MAQSLDMFDETEALPVVESAETAAPVAETVISPAAQRFETCRWRQAAEDPTPAHCTHRDVAPMAGVQTFNPEAWCLDCGFYKVRRTPKKRPSPLPQDRYYY
jgi:hypothetical protein